jgi:hypothetical protein
MSLPIPFLAYEVHQQRCSAVIDIKLKSVDIRRVFVYDVLSQYFTGALVKPFTKN